MESHPMAEGTIPESCFVSVRRVIDTGSSSESGDF